MVINKNDITVMSYERYCDYIGENESICWFDGNIVQYSIGTDFVSFCFCDAEPSDINGIKQEILKKMDTSKYPIWTQLSDTLKSEIIQSEFDMCFIEYDAESWTDEKAEKVFNEAVQLGLDSCITKDEDDCYLTFYAGAMCNVNWQEHEKFGNQYFNKKIKSIESIFEEHGFIIEFDEYLNQIDIYNKNNNNSVCSLFFYSPSQYDSSFDEIDEIIYYINSIDTHYMRNLIINDNSIERRLSALEKELSDEKTEIFWEREPMFLQELKNEISCDYDEFEK